MHPRVADQRQREARTRIGANLKKLCFMLNVEFGEAQHAHDRSLAALCELEHIAEVSDRIVAAAIGDQPEQPTFEPKPEADPESATDPVETAPLIAGLDEIPQDTQPDPQPFIPEDAPKPSGKKGK